MSATVEIKGNVAQIMLSGKLDFSIQKDIHNIIDEALADTSTREIQVDLAGVTFLDSSIIQAFLTLQEKAKRGNKSVILLNCRETIREIFTIGGFDNIFTIR